MTDAPAPVLTGTTPAPATQSAWAPYRHMSFAVLWTATVIANIGTWMYNAGSGWLMTTLNPNPFVVSLVQVATDLPIFFFAIAAGALADIIDRRRYLIVIEIASTAIAAVIALLVWLRLVTPAILLLFTFLLGAGAAFEAPAWQAVVPQLVPRANLPSAVAANSVGINVSRAIGPALAGLLIGSIAMAAPFWANALLNLVSVAALWWWKPHRPNFGGLRHEKFFGAVRAGFRHARYNPHLRSTLMRAVAFFIFASAYWALLPLVARSQVRGGPELYGALLGGIGAGAVGGAFALPRLKAWVGPDRLVAIGTLGTAVTLILFGLARESFVALLASVIAGVSWIAVLASLNVSAQVALPDWVRARGLSMFVTVLYGSMTAGSALWGHVAGLAGLPQAHFIAAAGALIMVPLTWRWKLQTAASLDLTPSMHWPTPLLSMDVAPDRGPVLVTVEYRVGPQEQHAFLTALQRLAQERRRDGAYDWNVFEDAADPGRFLETFQVESWLEHLRQHERVTNADRAVQRAVDRFQLAGQPKVTHFIAVTPDDAAY